MTGGPRFSVIICTFNRATELVGAVESVLAQSFADFELVVVDDGSTDDTRSVVQGITDPRVRYEHRPNGGLSAARNTGVTAASGRFVLFLDDDDRVLPTLLATVAPITDAGDVALVSWGAQYVDEVGTALETLLPEPLGPAFEDYTALFRAGTFAVTRDAYLAAGGFAEDLRTSHQTEFALRVLPLCRARGLGVRSLDVPLIRIVRRSAGARERNEPLRLLSATLYIVDRHEDRLRRSPEVLADYLATAGVAAARAGRYREARHLFGRAARSSRVRSRRWKHRSRQLVAWVPPLAVRRWDAGPQAQAVPATPAAGTATGPADRTVATVFYRGPFQGRRLRFLLDVAARVDGTVDVVWLNPKFDASAPQPWIERLRGERPYLRTVEERDGSWRSVVTTTRGLRSRFGRPDHLFAIGFTSLPFARALRPRRLVWAVNGIPEERLLHDGSARARAFVHLQWLTCRVGRRPDIVVVVSRPMGALVERKLPGVTWTNAPTCVDLTTFAAPADTVRTHFTYIGSGAPWQGIELVAPIWKAIHELDPSARFRIVSRDERAEALGAGLPASVVEVVAGGSPTEVAQLLWSSQLAFLVRAADIVNATSFPTKFGEYVAAGVPVVSTDVGWEVSSIIRDTGCGLIIDASRPPLEVAREILAFRTRSEDDPAVLEGCAEAAHGLDRESWADRAAGAIARALSPGSASA